LIEREFFILAARLFFLLQFPDFPALFKSEKKNFPRRKK